jgi:hypothetical protein
MDINLHQFHCKLVIIIIVEYTVLEKEDIVLITYWQRIQKPEVPQLNFRLLYALPGLVCALPNQK